MRGLSQYREHIFMFSQARNEMDKDMKKEKEVKAKRGSVK